MCLVHLIDALRLVADQLDQDFCWLHRGRFHFPLGGGWSVAISVESANRIRVDACQGTEPRDTLYVLGGDRERLAELVIELAGHAAVTV